MRGIVLAVAAAVAVGLGSWYGLGGSGVEKSAEILDADSMPDAPKRAYTLGGKPGMPATIENYRPEHPVEWAVTRSQARFSEEGDIPHGALMKAIRQRQALIDGQSAGIAAVRAGLGPDSWTWRGPGNIGGRVRAIVFDPDDGNHMWAGSVSGGLWETVNAGIHWEPVETFVPNLAITSIVINPFNPDEMYVGTGEGGFFLIDDGSSNTAAMRGAGVFKSTDRGQTWAQLPSTDSPDWHHVCRLGISPVDGNTLLAATATGLYRSTDGGQTWSLRSANRTLDVKFHPTNGSLAVAGRADGTSLYTTDGGVNWSLSSGFTTATRIELAYAPSQPTTVYACVSHTNARLKIWASTDGGKTFTQRTTGTGYSTLAIYDNALWIDPTNVNTLVLGGLHVYRSTNGGTSATQISNYTNANSAYADQHLIVSHPGFNGTTNRTVYVGDDGGVFRTLNIYTAAQSSGWENMNRNLGITQLYGAGVGPTGRIIAGAQDNSTMIYNGDPQNWQRVIGGDGGFCAADPVDPNTIYGTAQRHNIFRSSNGGANFTGITDGPNPLADRGGADCNFIPYYMLDPNDSNRMLAAAARLWRTNNVKASEPDWFSIKAVLPDCVDDRGAGDDPDHYQFNSPCNMSTIAVARGNSNVIWVGYNRGDVYMSTNGAAATPAWTRIDTNDPRLPQRWVSRIAIDPNDHDRVYVVYLGYEPDNVWLTEDAGQTWTPIAGQTPDRLPDVPVTSILLHPTKPGWLYVGTDIGIFASEDDGQSWSANDLGPTTIAVDELIWRDNCHFLAITHGRGVYEADICDPCAAINSLKPKCKSGGKVTATVKSSLPPGSVLNLTLDGADNRQVTTNNKGTAKAKWSGAAPGTHAVCIVECPSLCQSVTCP